MNYHFQPASRKQELLGKLQQLDNSIKNDNKSLQRLKLEADFYEDKGKPIPINKESLADEIMKELISEPYKPRYQPVKRDYMEPPQYQLPPKEYFEPPIKQELPQAPRQNNFINERQLQKNKLQNQKHEGLFPNSSDHNRIRSYGKQAPQLVPEQDKNTNYKPLVQNSPVQRKNNSPQYHNKFNPNYNPFVKDDTLEKQLKEEKNREYLKALEEQRLEQERKKKERMKEDRDIKVQQYDNYQPPQVKNEIVQKPLGMKKTDPNSKPPKVEPTMGNYSQFDKNLIKSKVIELKNKRDKGKVIYEEFERQVNNFRKQYPGDDFNQFLQSLQNKKNRKEGQNRNPSTEDRERVELTSRQEPKIQSRENLDQLKNEGYNMHTRNQSGTYSQFMPSMNPQTQFNALNVSPGQMYAPPSLTNPPSALNMASMQGMMPPASYLQGGFNSQYVELVKKLFDHYLIEMREMRNEHSTQNKAYQQTLQKLLMMNTQTNFMTQQIPSIPTQLQKQFYSDTKQHREYFEKESIVKKKPLPSNESLAHIPFGESDNSQYYDKSLSGIASKVPINNQRLKTKEDQKVVKQSTLDQFYRKKYKVKPLGKFNFMVDSNQSQGQIPSTSSYLRAKYAKQQLKQRFQDDLNELKRIQTDKSMKKFAGKVSGNASYSDRRILKDPIPKSVSANPYESEISLMVKHKQSVFDNPFLKKHISTDQNILTFNNKQIKINSPTGYSPVSKKEILEQDEYQTEPRVRQDPRGASSLIQDYQQKTSQQPVKALNFIKFNNQVLSKYDRTEQSKKQYITIKDSEIKETKDYFNNNQISPVKREQVYEESLQTIRSDFESVKNSQRPQKSNIQESKSKRKLIHQDLDRQNDDIRYSQTVQSIEESSSHLQKPPIAKKRSIGKKKESSISRSKNPHDSALSRNSFHIEESQSMQVPKFDSNVYQSNYQDSVNLVKPNKIAPQLILNQPSLNELQPQIQFNPPTIITPKGHYSNEPQEQDSKQISKVSQPQSKWKSLEQARKLAKECRVKAIDDSKDYRSVQQKFSELESFMTKRGDQSQNMIRQSPSELKREKELQKVSNKEGKRNILKLLQQLEDNHEEYKQEFQSYREQSEQYQ